MNININQMKKVANRLMSIIFRNIFRITLVLLVIAVGLLFWLIHKESEVIAASQHAASRREKPPINVAVVELTSLPIRDRISLPGSIVPWTELELKAKIDGTVEEVFVQEGDSVVKGDVIARVEDTDYRIAVDKARAAYTLARSDFERNNSIYSKGIIPTADIEARRTAMQTAKADLESAELLLSRCLITAPMSGVVEKLDAKTGLLLAVGDPVGVLLQLNRLKAVIGIPESDVCAIRNLEEIELTVQALENRKVVGRTHFLSRSPGSVARLYNLELAIDNSDGTLLPGMFVRAEIIKRTVENSVAVPFYSVISHRNMHHVFIEVGGIAEKRNVQLGIMEKGMLQITEGLRHGERLVVEGHRTVEDRQQVKVIRLSASMKELML